MIKIPFTVSAALALLLSAAGVARAADVTFLCAIALRPAMAHIVPEFERTSSHKVAIEYGAIGAIAERIRQGDVADVAVVSRQHSEELQKQGRIVAGSVIVVARAGYALYVRAGETKPDIRSVDALKQTLLAAKSIVYADPAAGAAPGIYAARLMERLGIATEMKPKTKVLPPGEGVLKAVAEGEAALGLTLATSTLAGVERVGPLPADVQSYTDYTAGIPASSKRPDAGKAFLRFITSPDGTAVLKSLGFETPQ